MKTGVVDRPNDHFIEKKFGMFGKLAGKEERGLSNVWPKFAESGCTAVKLTSLIVTFSTLGKPVFRLSENYKFMQF